MSKKPTKKAAAQAPAPTAAPASTERVVTQTELLPETAAQIEEWQKLTSWLEVAKKRENELRNIIVAAAKLPADAPEGVNLVQMGDFAIKVDLKVNRTLDLALLDSVMNQLPEESNARKLDVLITYKPSLVMTGFRALGDEERKVFQQALTEKPGLPGLSIEAAKPDASAPPPIPAPPSGKKGKGKKAK